VDAIAVPFVQGLIRGEEVRGKITTECAHCHQPLHIAMDSRFECQVEEADASPVYFAPLSGIDPGEPNIIDGF
jgi:hypothetical protein